MEHQPPVSAIDCLIAIPCYQESARLPSFLDTLCPSISAAPFSARIVVVDDGSGAPEAERTREIVSRAAAQWTGLFAEPVLLPANLGKGGAVYAGWESPEAFAAALLCFVDADGSVPAAEVVRLIGELLADRAERWQAIFGSRVKLLGARVERLPSRHYVGRVFATLVTIITGLTIYDSQCGLKVVRRHAYTTIARELTERRFVFDVELVLRLLRHGFGIREVPIDWSEIPGSKVRLLRDSWRMATGLLRIRERLRADGEVAKFQQPT
jgi:dolichyl-phosphate beta-glucosyltransferase